MTETIQDYQKRCWGKYKTEIGLPTNYPSMLKNKCYYQNY